MDKLGTTRSVRTGYDKQVTEVIYAIVADDLILSSSFVLTNTCLLILPSK